MQTQTTHVRRYRWMSHLRVRSFVDSGTMMPHTLPLWCWIHFRKLKMYCILIFWSSLSWLLKLFLMVHRKWRVYTAYSIPPWCRLFRLSVLWSERTPRKQNSQILLYDWQARLRLSSLLSPYWHSHHNTVSHILVIVLSIGARILLVTVLATVTLDSDIRVNVHAQSTGEWVP